MDVTRLYTETLFKVPFSIIPGVALALMKLWKPAKTIFVSSTKTQGLESIVNEDPYIFLTHPFARQAFDCHFRRERYDFRRIPLRIWVPSRVVEGFVLLIQQSYCRENCNHLIIVWEISIYGTVQRKRDRTRCQSPVRLSIITDGRGSEPRD